VKHVRGSTPRNNAVQWEDRARDKDSYRPELEGVNLHDYTLFRILLSADVLATSG